MGVSVFSEVDTNKYFSVSTISKAKMKQNGLNLSIKQLRALALKSVPVTEILTGKPNEHGRCRKTKIYAYEAFKGVSWKDFKK